MEPEYRCCNFLRSRQYSSCDCRNRFIQPSTVWFTNSDAANHSCSCASFNIFALDGCHPDATFALLSDSFLRFFEGGVSFDADAGGGVFFARTRFGLTVLRRRRILSSSACNRIMRTSDDFLPGNGSLGAWIDGDAFVGAAGADVIAVSAPFDAGCNTDVSVDWTVSDFTGTGSFDSSCVEGVSFLPSVDLSLCDSEGIASESSFASSFESDASIDTSFSDSSPAFPS
mmetsp:Transcript_14754/g.36107  ORF Transcript_14754/g.36107 Transcript_14754/m.36107 type:complete len:228 (-) Transcript_14754:920-1603(-)